MKEQTYITYRKIKGRLHSLCFYLCRVFPIDKKLVSVCTFEGKGGFGCNPKYVVQELHKQDPSYKFVWFLNKSSWDKEFPDYIKKVPNTLWSRAYWLSRSKVWIDNYRKPLGTVKRKGQYYLNTNHFTIAIKATGLLRGDGFSPIAYLVSKNDSDMIDDLVIDSKWCEECFDKALVYDGHMLKSGAPRCDILYGDRSEQKKAFREKHNLPLDSKVVMFAPTFREGAKDGKRFVYSELWSIDFARLLKNLEKRFGGEWYLCIRVHPQLAPTFKEYSNPDIQDRIIDESQADDMYEILAGMDLYITDYSSAIFEAGAAGIPSFIYADDIDKYTKDRGSLMWELSAENHYHVTNNVEFLPNLNLTLPYTVAIDNKELESQILGFEDDNYSEIVSQFYDILDMTFDGHSAERIVDTIRSN